MAKQGRRPLDAYHTPARLALAICERVRETIQLPSQPTILEAGCGTGSFIRAAKEVWDAPWIAAVDIDNRYGAGALEAGAAKFSCCDYTAGGTGEQFSLVIGNPPYGLGEEFVERACMEGNSVVFLMRAAFRAGMRRWTKGGVFVRHPPAVTWPVVPRPSFTGGGTEHSEYEVFLWTKQTIRAREVEPIIWREKP